MNELQIIFLKGKSQPDRKYRILVQLQRADRPRYWNFLCNNCGTKVVELQNYEILSMTDFYDPQSPTNAAVGRPCKGYVHGQGSCPYTYFFVLN